MKKRTLLNLLLIPFLMISVHAQGTAVKTYEKGSKVVSFQSADQHGKAYTFKKGTRYLMITFDMSTGKNANKVLHEKGAAYLPAKKAVYVANIHGMPGIGRRFALPKMKKYAHRIILADADGLLDPFPKQKGKVTVLALSSSGVVSAISYWDPESQNIDDVLK